MPWEVTNLRHGLTVAAAWGLMSVSCIVNQRVSTTS